MRRGERQNALAHPERRQAIPLLKMSLEGLDTVARGREMAADGNIMVPGVAKRAWDHADGPMFIADCQLGFRRVVVEGFMYAANEAYSRRLRQVIKGKAAVNISLDPNMGTSLDLQIAALLGRVELARHRALNFAQGCVVALDQVGVIAVHHAHGVCQRGSGSRMQPCSHPAAGGRQGATRSTIAGGVFEQTRFNSTWCFDHNGHADLVTHKSKDMTWDIVEMILKFADLVAERYSRIAH
jgi:hypothetical protein